MPRLVPRIAAVCAAVFAFASPPAAAVDRGRLEKCVKDPRHALDCVSGAVNDEVNNAKKGLQADLDKAKHESEDLKKQLDAARKQGGAVLSQVTGPSRDFAVCLHDKGKAAGIDPVKMATNPQQAVRDALARVNHLRAAAIAEVLKTAPRLKKITFTADSAGASVDLRIQPPQLNVAQLLNEAAASIEKAANATRDPVATCLVGPLKREMQKLAPVLQDEFNRLAPVVAHEVEALAAKLVASAIDDLVGMLGEKLGDKDARITMRGVIADQLLNPAKVQQIAQHVDQFSRALPSKAQAQTRADAAIAIMNKEWQPSGRFVVALAAPAVKAAGRKVAELIVHNAWPPVYDNAMQVPTTAVQAVFVVVEEACAAGDVFVEWACSIATKVVRFAWDLAVNGGRQGTTALLTMAAKGAVDLTVDKLAPEVADLAENKADPKAVQIANKYVPQAAQQKLRGFAEKVMTNIAGKEVESVMAATKVYNTSVAGAMRACVAIAK